MSKEQQAALEASKRLDAALVRRKDGRFDDYPNEHCEVCGDHIRRYIGPKPGVVCTNCLETTGQGQCVRFMPLVIWGGSTR